MATKNYISRFLGNYDFLKIFCPAVSPYVNHMFWFYFGNLVSGLGASLGEITPEKVKSDLWHVTQVCQPKDGNLKCSMIKKKSSAGEWHWLSIWLESSFKSEPWSSRHHWPLIWSNLIWSHCHEYFITWKPRKKSVKQMYSFFLGGYINCSGVSDFYCTI